MKAATRVLALLMAVAASPASVGASDDSATAAEQRRSNWVTEGLLDPAAPAAHRAEIANKLETLANEGNDPHALYVAGSLYRLGRENSPTSPFPRNADKAREYLTRAALRAASRDGQARPVRDTTKATGSRPTSGRSCSPRTAPSCARPWAGQ